MKRYLILIIAITVVLAGTWAVFGQAAERPRGQGREGRGMFGMLTAEERQKWQNMSQEERQKLMAQMRERWQNMSDEEREKLREQMRQRFAGTGRGPRMGREDQLKAIETIEKELKKLKTAIESFNPEDMGRFRDASEEERNKLREKMMKVREERQAATNAIITQIAMLQGQRQPAAEGERLIILNTAQLKPIQELAVKEKATETAQRLERLISGRRFSGFGGRRPGAERRDPEATERPTRPGGTRGQRGTGRRQPSER